MTAAEHSTLEVDAREDRASILLVQDHEASNAVGLLLRERGYVVHEASSSTDALALATAEPLDLLVTELYTPRLNGVALAARIMGSGAAVEVLYLTDLAPDEVTRAVGAPLVALRRPFSMAVLCDRIEAALVAR